MYKQWEEEQWRIDMADDAKITFSIALRGKHAWEMQVEDSRRYHSISHGWATDNPHDWENTIVPVLRPLFPKIPLRLATNVPIYDPPVCSPATRPEINLKAFRATTPMPASPPRFSSSVRDLHHTARASW